MSAFFEGAFPELHDRLPEDFHRTPKELAIPDPPAAAPKRKLTIFPGPKTGKFHLLEELEGGAVRALQSFPTREAALEEKRRLEGSAA
ncbi:MAG TPA: hypothetical protein VJ623_05450 [Holophagaceae bacterium]|nr:hypothetical protein [Holophagaceae bacterium]